ncbi:MAG TPA: acyltransferase family protein [Acidimicrobiia bacterium]
MTTSASETRPSTLRYLPGLDGLRAISVLAVIVFHHYLVGGHEAGWAPGGFLGVEVFFVVSGYLITSLLLNERRETGRVSLRAFYLRRARRLLPALFTLLAVIVAYSLLFLPDAIGTLRSDTVAALTYTSNWWQMIAHRSYIAQAGRPELLKHLWSLAIEEQYYLAWPFLLMFGLRKLGRQRMFTTMITTALASTLLLALLAHGSVDDAYYATYTRLSGLLLGSAFAFSFAPYRIRGLPGRGARAALDAAGTLGLLVLLGSFGMLHHFGINGFSFPTSHTDNLAVFHGGFLLVDLATLLVIAAAVHPSSDIGRALGCKPLRWIGLRSYSLYLWHYPIFCVTRPGLDIHRLGIWFLSIQYAGWPVFVFRLALSFGAAELSYRFVETPIRKGAISRYRAVVREAVGERRRRLVRRGAVIGSSLTIVALMLGTGLATAQPQATGIPGVGASGQQNGAKLDPSALQALQDTPTTAPKTAVTRLGSRPTTTTLPRVSIATGHVLGIGDSVMEGAKTSLVAAIPGMAVDAVKSRQFSQAIQVVQQYESLSALPAVLVIHLGTNGHITSAQFDQMMRTIGPRHTVFFLTARVPRLWEAEVNVTLHAGVKRWPNARLLEWRDYSGCHDDWFVNDGFHLRTPGQHAYAAFVHLGLMGKAPTTCTK